ncbi:MAG TPA: class I SAM-dependent methyltransferase [Acidobacteriaceae bacterium]|nr:class I SAM-dependent methyltransferase [Acidobacteriaceae bacterium]
MSNIHHAAAEGFSAGAATYVAGRPDYPPEIEAWLINDLGLGPGKTALDLAAGTGKFSARLLGAGASVIAVEPVSAMREQLVRQFPEIDARSGRAQNIPLDGASVDAVVCAQAFHWFATAEAVREIHRVLKPGGAFGLIWNVRDETVPWVAALGRLMKPFEGDAPRFSSQKWRNVFPADGFSPLREKQFTHRHTGPPEKVIIDRILSVSFMAALPPAEQEVVTSRLRDVISAYPELAGKTEVTFPYKTLACVCNRLPYTPAGEML